MLKIADFEKHWGQRDADYWRDFQSEALLELYRRVNGRDAVDIAELVQWIIRADLSAYGKPIDPSRVFSPEHAKKVMERIIEQ